MIHLFCLNALYGQSSSSTNSHSSTRKAKRALLATKINNEINELIGDVDPHLTLILVSIGSTILNAYSYKGDKRTSDQIEQAIDDLEVLAAELRTLQKKHIVIGLTSNANNTSLVNGRLIALNVKMSFCDRCFDVEYKDNYNKLLTQLFNFGVLFCGDPYKGQAVVALMQKLNIKPQKIIFICDTVDDFKSIGSVIVEKLKVQCSGLSWSNILTI
jgi:hypothetical protein